MLGFFMPDAFTFLLLQECMVQSGAFADLFRKWSFGDDQSFGSRDGIFFCRQ